MKKKKSKAKPKSPPVLQYKVVELSSVDESSLEYALNEWVSQGWTFDGVQFAMRDASKRPSMAFMFFTREGKGEHAPRTTAQALSALMDLSHGGDRGNA